MTNRGLFALLASASIVIDVVIVTVLLPRWDVAIFTGIYAAMIAAIIFGAYRGYRLAIALAIANCAWSIFNAFSAFSPSANMLATAAGVISVGMMIAALAFYFRHGFINKFAS